MADRRIWPKDREKGMEPSFWLLPASKKWPLEIDIREFLDKRNYMANYAAVHNQFAQAEGLIADRISRRIPILTRCCGNSR